MGQSSHVEPPPSSGGNLFWWVCTKNPFYAISAALVLWGLWVSFGQQVEEVDTWLLVSGLAGYTLLLSATALILVRYLKLWEDARTVLLLVVLLFLAASFPFDRVLIEIPERGALCYLLGLGLSVLVSETLLLGLRLRLPALYRVPYYLILALFFLYPIVVQQLRDPEDPVAEPILWGLFGFSTVAGLLFLTLLPAVQRGADYIRDNGSPLPWPLYPWSLFAVLALAVPGRAILMCWSLHSLQPNQFDRLVFGPYFLVPFGFAIAVVLLELGLVLSRVAVVRFCLAVPLVLIGLSLVGHSPADPIYRMLRVVTTSMGEMEAFGAVRTDPDPVYGAFLRIFAQRLGGDPLFLTLVLSACFYGYAAIRRVPLAGAALSAVLASLAFVSTTTLSTGLLSSPEPEPLLGAAALLLALGLVRNNVWSCLLGAVCLAGAIASAIPLPESMGAAHRAGIFLNLLVLAMLVLGAVFSNRSGLVIRGVGVSLVLLMALAVMHGWARLPEGVLPWSPIAYPLVMGILLVVYGQLLHDSFSLMLAAALLGYWVLLFGWTAYRTLRLKIQGFDQIVCGLGFFAVAVLVSLGKAGVLTRWIESRWGPQSWLRASGQRGELAPVGTASPLPIQGPPPPHLVVAQLTEPSTNSANGETNVPSPEEKSASELG